MRDTTEITKQRRSVASAKKAPFWAGANFVATISLLTELSFSFVPRVFDQNIINNVITIMEFLLLLLFVMNTFYNLYLYVWLKSLMQPIELSSREYDLFGIAKDEIGFSLEKPKSPSDTADEKNASFRKYMPKFEMNNSGSFINSSIDSAAMSTRLHDTSMNTTNASWSFRKNVSMNSSFNATGKSLSNVSFDVDQPSIKLFATGGSTMGSIDKTSSAMFQHQNVKDLEKPKFEMNNSGSFINSSIDSAAMSTRLHDTSMNTNNASLSFLKNVSMNSSLNATANTTGNATEKSLSNVSFDVYQPSIKVFATGGSTMGSIDKTSSAMYQHQNAKDLEKILSILETTETSLTHMVENIRRWISQTILTRLSEQIDVINKQISGKGYIEGIVGETPVQQLKSFAQSKEKEFPSLPQIYSFVDIHSKTSENSAAVQRYLVRRIKDMSKGGCITDYIWNAGGTYNYKPWKDDFPTDAELLLHLFAVYMDSRILFNPALPDGQDPFTSQYLKLLSSSNPPKSDTYIEQISVSPPHYNVVIKKEKFDLPAGRNNLFYALLVFINHIQTKKFGLLGRINLSSSGLNISWVINDALKQ